MAGPNDTVTQPDDGRPVVTITPRDKPNQLSPGDQPLAPSGNDLGANYIAGKKMAQTNEVLDAWMQRLNRARAAPAGTGEPPSFRPGGDGGDRPPRPPTVSVTEPTTTFVDRLTSAPTDIGTGIIEAPRQAIGGVTDKVRNGAIALDNLANWLNDHVVDTRIDGLPNPLSFIAENTPKIDAPKSVTGGVIRGVTEFLTGFAAGGRMLDTVAPGMGAAPRMFAAGAISDASRDPDGGRLADLLDKVPALRGPVMDFFKSDPNDSEAEKRLKNALEGLGLGAATQGMGLALKYLRVKYAARGRGGDLKAIVDDPKRVLAQMYGELSPEQIQSLGNRKRAAVVKVMPDQMRKKIEAAGGAVDRELPDTAEAAKGLLFAGVDPGGQQVYINMARIDTPDDVKGVLQTMANTFAPEIDKAKRGIQSNEATKELADELGMSVQDVLNRRHGQGFNAEQSLAARRLLNTIGAELVDAAKKASLPDASPLELFAFRKLLAMHQAVQAEVLGARTEAARALQAWSIPADLSGGIDASKQINAAIDAMGGKGSAQDLAQKMAMLAGKNDPTTINKFVRESMFTKTANALREIYVNNLLTNPKTHIVNFVSNAIVTLQMLGEQRIAESVSKMFGGTIQPGEAVTMLNALPAAMKDAFKAAWLAAKTGQSGFGATRIDSPRLRALSAQAFGADPDSAVGRTLDYLGFGLNVPTRLLMTSDEFFKGINYRMGIYEQAQRQVMAEGLEGPEAAKRLAELVTNPTETMQLLANERALYSTFSQAPGPVGRGFIAFRDKVPLGWYFFPFVKTPANIVTFAFERSPLAPLVQSWRADLAAGGARRDLALARMGTGTVIMLMAADYADSGYITGGGPYSNEEAGKSRRQAAQRQGWQPYSIRSGDRWYSYNRLDPVGMTLGFAADLVDLKNRHEIDDDHMDEFTEIAGAAMAAVARTTDNKTYMQSYSDFFEAMSDPSRNMKGYFDKQIGALVPSVSGLVAQIDDPTQRETMRTIDYIDAKIVGLRNKLTPRRDLWGEEQGDRSGFGNTFSAMSPMQVSEVKESPIDAEIEKQQFSVLPIPKKASFDGVPVDFTKWPQVYDEYVRLAGNDLKHPAWGLGLKDLLDQIVTGKHPLSQVYRMKSDGPGGGKELFIQQQVSEFRRLAQQQIMNDPRFADFANEVSGKKQKKDDLRLPNGVTVH